MQWNPKSKRRRLLATKRAVATRKAAHGGCSSIGCCSPCVVHAYSVAGYEAFSAFLFEHLLRVMTPFNFLDFL